MVNAGKDCIPQPMADQIADANLRTLRRSLPVSIRTVNYLGRPVPRRRVRSPRRDQQAEGVARRRPVRAVEPLVLVERRDPGAALRGSARTPPSSATAPPACRSRPSPRRTSRTSRSRRRRRGELIPDVPRTMSTEDIAAASPPHERKVVSKTVSLHSHLRKIRVEELALELEGQKTTARGRRRRPDPLPAPSPAPGRRG